MSFLRPLEKDEEPCADCTQFRGEWCCTMNCGPVQPRPKEDN